MKYSLKKGVAVALATLGLASCFTACGKNNDKNETVPQTEITQEIDSTIEEKTIPFKREDGSYLMLLVTNYKKTKKISYNVGYITYDKNGIYFDNALTDTRVIISDESIFPFESTKFYYLKISSLCDEKHLLDGKISESIISDIITPYEKEGAYIDNYTYGKTNLKFYKDYTYYYTEVVELKVEYIIEELQRKNDNAVYTLDQTEPLKTTETTTYTDADDTTIENPTETTSAKTLS